MHDFGEFALKVADSGDASDMMAYTTAETAAVDAALKRVRSQAYQADAGRVSKGGDTMQGTLTTPKAVIAPPDPASNAQLQLAAKGFLPWIVQNHAGDGIFQILRANSPTWAFRIEPSDLKVGVQYDLEVGGQLAVAKTVTADRLVAQSSGYAQLQLKSGASPGWVVQQGTDGSWSVGRINPSGADDAIRIDHNTLNVTVPHDLTADNLTAKSSLYLAQTGALVGWMDAGNYQFLLRYPQNGKVSAIDHDQMHHLVYALASGNPSSRRFKTGIQPADDVPDVAALAPVTYRFKSDAQTPLTDDQRTSPQLGLIAEDVAEVDSRLAQRNAEGQVTGLDYTALIAALVDKVQKLEARIAQLEAGS